MIVHFAIRKKTGSITVEGGQAQVDFPDPKIRDILEDRLNTVQDITFQSRGIDGSPRVHTSTTIPATDDGMLVYYLNAGVPGLRKKITIKGVEGSDKVTFKGTLVK